MELLYDKVDAGLGNTAFYSGRISAVKWRAKTSTDNNPREKAYLLSYDLQDRMKSAQYRDRLGATSWGNIGSFDEKGLTYDANGNLLTLQRTALISGVSTAIDNINYSYTGDKMTNVSEGSTGSLGTYGFRNLTGSTATYSYDAVGAVSVDPKKGLSFAYNVLGLTAKTTITTATNRYVDYTYNASGTILRARHYNGGTLVKTLDYVGGYVYENGAISYFSMVEGRVRNVGGVLKPEYMLKDHQGNVRVSFEEQSGVAVVRQENSYYPFGLQFPGTVIPSGANRNLYNGGSEWENAFSNLPDLYRTDHRMYDPALGRFLSPDPMALSSAGYGTYHYSYNNPLMFNDPLGLKAQPGSGGGITGPYGEFWNSAMSYTSGTGAYMTPSQSGWDVAEFSSSEAAFYFAAAGMAENGSWGLNSGWAGNYEEAASRYNASNVGQVATKFYRLNEIAVTRQGFNSGAWVSQAQAQVANFWSRGSTAQPLPYSKEDEKLLGGALSFVEKHFNGNIGLIGFAGTAYEKIPNSVKRSLAYKLSKLTKWKAGEIFQTGKSLSKGVGRLATKAGVAGSLLTGSVILYEFGTNTWDAHTFVNTVMLGAGTLATIYTAPVVLMGIAAYGISDYFFDFSGKIDSTVGRESNIW